MIVDDHKLASLAATSVLALSLLIFAPSVALAEETAPNPAPPSSSASAATTPATVTVVDDGSVATFATQARTVGDLLAERGITLGAGDYLSSDPAVAVADGQCIVVRSAQPIRLQMNAGERVVRSAAETVGDFLRDQHVRIGRNDDVSPAPSAALVAGETVSVVRIRTWTSHERANIAQQVLHRTDRALPAGRIETVASGRPGTRETVVRFTRRGDGATTSTVLASRVILRPQPTVVVRGIGTYATLERVASQGFESAIHMAGTALHMIATAYTGSCYGCSGVTASGVRAGFGVIAVDPRMIPLGTRVFIPGYGKAVAGDTGGAIQGHRIDLGFNSRSDAMQFGRRPVTLYVLR